MIYWSEIELPVDPPGSTNVLVPEFTLTLTFKLRQITESHPPRFDPISGDADPGGPAEYEPVAIFLNNMELTWKQAHEIFDQDTLSHLLRVAEDQCQ